VIFQFEDLAFFFNLAILSGNTIILPISAVTNNW